MITTIVIGLGGYILVTLAVGLYAGRKVKDSSDFLVAGRRLGIVLSTGTLTATWFGGGTCIGAASAAYNGGFLSVIADPFGASLCLFLAGLFYVKTLRRMGLNTIAEFFSSRFGRAAGLAAAVCTVPTYVGWVASLMVAFGRVIQSLTGLDPTLGICISALIVLVYTTAGGMWAVTLTDFIQVLVLIIGLAVLTPILLSDMGGWAALRAQVPDDRFYLYPHEGGLGAWFHYARDWLVIGLGNLAGQDLIQRSLSARNEKVAQHSAYLSGILYLTVGLLPVFLGIAASVVFPGLEDSEFVLMKIAMTYLPPIGIAVFLGALVSALMSSADSALLAPASVIGWDVVRFFRPDVREKHILAVCRICVPVLGLLSLYLALKKNTVYSLMVDSWSVLLATLFVPLTAGIWWKGANRPGALAAMASGAATWLVLLAFAPHLPADLLAVPVSLGFLVCASLMTRRTAPPFPLVDAAGRPITAVGPFGVWAVAPPAAREDR